jgi:hypothetical protein
MPDLRQEFAARGDRRRRRAAVATPAAAVLALALAGGAATLLTNRDGHEAAPPLSQGQTSAPSPSASSASPSAHPGHVVSSGDIAWITHAAVLEKSDVGKDLVVTEVTEVQPAPTQPDWIFAAQNCPAYQRLAVSTLPYLFRLRQGVHRAATAAPSGELEIRRYAITDVGVVLPGVRQVVESCPSFETADAVLSTADHPAINRRSYTVLATGFAGDESLLLRGTVQQFTVATGQPLGDPVVTVVAVIRVKDLVTVVDLGLDDPDRVTGVAKIAARKLCAATTC